MRTMNDNYFLSLYYAKHLPCRVHIYRKRRSYFSTSQGPVLYAHDQFQSLLFSSARTRTNLLALKRHEDCFDFLDNSLGDTVCKSINTSITGEFVFCVQFSRKCNISFLVHFNFCDSVDNFHHIFCDESFSKLNTCTNINACAFKTQLGLLYFILKVECSCVLFCNLSKCLFIDCELLDFKLPVFFSAYASVLSTLFSS